MVIKTIPLSQLVADPRGTLNKCADSGEPLVIELLGHGRVAIQPLDTTDNESLVSELLESNPVFQALVSKSNASPRKPL